MKSILELSNYVNLVVSVAIEKEGKYLMVQEAKKGIENLWNFPSGKVKENEDLMSAAKREVLEETGYDIEITGLCSVYHYSWDDNSGITIRFNLLAEAKEEKTKELAKDVISAEFLDKTALEEVINNKTYRFGGTALMIKDVIGGKKTDLNTLITTNKSIEEIWKNATN